jgi:hypothetical protein
MTMEQSLAWNLSPLMLGVVCLLCPVILSYLGLLLTRKLISPHFLKVHHDVTGPFFCTLGTVYGIFLALVVTTTWQAYNTTQSNIVQEARCLGDLYSDTHAFGSPFQEQTQKLLQHYRDVLVNKEWQALARGKGSPEATKLLQEITMAYAHHSTANSTEASFFSDSVQNLNKLKELRASRIDDSSSGLLSFLWCVLLAGAVATISFSYLFRTENCTVQAVMTMLLTTVICLTLYTIVNLDFGFSGLVALDSEPLQKLQMD